jgi:hypothetical protein
MWCPAERSWCRGTPSDRAGSRTARSKPSSFRTLTERCRRTSLAWAGCIAHRKRQRSPPRRLRCFQNRRQEIADLIAGALRWLGLWLCDLGVSNDVQKLRRITAHTHHRQYEQEKPRSPAADRDAGTPTPAILDVCAPSALSPTHRLAPLTRAWAPGWRSKFSLRWLRERCLAADGLAAVTGAGKPLV